VLRKFEGGQLPLVKRMSHIGGFTNPFRVEYVPVNLERLAELEAGVQVTPQSLAQAGIIKGRDLLVKVLGRGELRQPLHVSAHKFSQSARQKIEAVGGTAQEL